MILRLYTAGGSTHSTQYNYIYKDHTYALAVYTNEIYVKKSFQICVIYFSAISTHFLLIFQTLWNMKNYKL